MSTCCRSSILTLTLCTWVSFSRCQSQHGCLDCHCHLQDRLTVFLLSLNVIPEDQLSLLSYVRNAWPWRTHLSLFRRLDWSQPHSGCCCDQEHFVPLRSKTPCSDTYSRTRPTGGKPHYWETEQVSHLYYSVCLEVHAHLHMQQEVTNPSSH